jgi:hypothetical protein
LQATSWPSEEIGELLADSCTAVEQATRAKLRSVNSKIHDLRRLEGVLARLVLTCQAGDRTHPCPVLGMVHEEKA